MSDQQVRLQSLLDDLESGRMTVAQACAAVRGMTWPRRHGKTAFQHRFNAAVARHDDPAGPGSFADVAHEYHAGRLTFAQYEQLHQAYEEALR